MNKPKTSLEKGYTYFVPSELTSMTNNEILLQAVLGIQTCKTKKDVMDILKDVQLFALADQKAKIREWLVIYYHTKQVNLIKLLEEFDKRFI